MLDPDRESNAEFTELIRQHQARLIGYISAMVRNFGDTEDLVQQTCMTLWEKFDEFLPGTDFGAWACEVARLKTLNFLRSQSRRGISFGEEFLAELAVVEANLGDQLDQRRDALRECIKKLPERQSQLLQRCYSERETVQQVAEQLERTTDGVYGSLRNIRRKLAECISHTLSREAMP